MLAAFITLALAGQAAPPATVRIDDFAYQPRTVTIRAGRRVRWVNRDISNHTVTFKRRPGDLGNISKGASRTARFTRAGRFTYVCTYHPGMRGTVVVRGPR